MFETHGEMMPRHDSTFGGILWIVAIRTQPKTVSDIQHFDFRVHKFFPTK